VATNERDLAAVAANSAGHLLTLVRAGRARTRGELRELTGLSRSALLQRIDALLAAGYLRTSGVAGSTGGRPSTVLEFNDRRQLVLAADLGATHARLAVVDLAGRPLVEHVGELDIADGPEAVLRRLTADLSALVDHAGARLEELCGIGLGVPGPVEFSTGRVVQPPIMPGWHDYPIREHLEAELGRPVLVDNDANLMALGEHATLGLDDTPLILVKVATGIGAGIVIDGRVYRGVDGGAGDIGHVRIAGNDVRCTCGSVGCLAAVASGRAIARRLDGLGFPTRSSRDVVSRLHAGEPDAIRLAREAGQHVGEVLATVVCLINPAVLIIAGDLAETAFVTGVREALYARALPRATRHLRVATSELGQRGGVVGAVRMVVDELYSPAEVDRRLASVSG